MGIFSAAGMFLLSLSDWCLSILYMQFIWTGTVKKNCISCYIILGLIGEWKKYINSFGICKSMQKITIRTFSLMQTSYFISTG